MYTNVVFKDIYKIQIIIYITMFQDFILKFRKLMYVVTRKKKFLSGNYQHIFF